MDEQEPDAEVEKADLTAIRGTIAFGLDAQAFMNSTLGRYLTGRANDEREQALEALKDADADNPKEIRKLQNDARCAENFLIWMAQAVAEGENAERSFANMSD